MYYQQLKEMVKQRHQRTPLKNTLYDTKEMFKRYTSSISNSLTIKYLVNKQGKSYKEALTISNELLTR